MIDLRKISIESAHSKLQFLKTFFPASNDSVLARFAAASGLAIPLENTRGNLEVSFSYRGIACAITSKKVTSVTGEKPYHSLEFTADYKSSDHFWLSVKPPGVFGKVERILGAQTFKTEDPVFNRKFTMRSSDTEKLAAICRTGGLRLAMKEAEACELETVNPNQSRFLPDGFRRIKYSVHGKVGSLESLNKQLQAFADVIDGLINSECIEKYS